MTNVTNYVRIGGATRDVLAITNVIAGDAGNYQVVVSNSHGSTTSSNVTLTVLIPPSITTQPTNRVVLLGSTTAFSAVGAGTEPLVYQWQKDGTNLLEGGQINGTTTSTLTISNVQINSIGSYHLVLSNTYGAVTSSYADLSIIPVVAWGYNAYGETDVPLAATNAVAIAAGVVHNLALRSDGSVIGWGSTDYDRVAVPAGLSNVVAIAAGGFHNLALKNDGSLVMWGDGTFGQTNMPSGLTNVVAITAGQYHSLALENDGKVIAWGYDGYNQTDAPTGLSNVIAVAAGFGHSLALQNNGTVTAWGKDDFGQANIPSGLSNVVAISAFENNSLALISDGTVVAWGNNSNGQTNVPAGLSNVIAIASGDSYSLALKNDGFAIGWGYNSNSSSPSVVPAHLNHIAAIAAGFLDSLVLVENPTVQIPPSIWWQPSSRISPSGKTTIFAPYVKGSLPFNFQWYFNGEALTGETNKWLVLNSIRPEQSGNYQFVATNNYGSVTGLVALLDSPTILQQPTNQSVIAGSNVTFTVLAVGSALNYQWMRNGTPLTDGAIISGATTSSLTISNIQAWDGTYWVVVSNAAGSVTSSDVNFSVLFPPSIFYQSLNQTNYSGATANLWLNLRGGTAPFGSRWYFNGMVITNGGRYFIQDSYWGDAPFVLYISNSDTNDAGIYWAVITNAIGSVTSAPMTLTVIVSPPFFTEQPEDIVTTAGSAEVDFHTMVQGSFPLSLQWYFNGELVTNETGLSFGVRSPQTNNAGYYWVVASNTCGVGTSSVARLSIYPTVIQNPVSQTVIAGTNIIFSSIIVGDQPMTNQWRLNGVPVTDNARITGSGTGTLSLSNVQPSDAGNYILAAANHAGSVMSLPAALNVLVPAAISNQPTNQAVLLGNPGSFSTTAVGTAPLKYRWYFNGAPLSNGGRFSGVTNSTFNISSVQTNDGGSYQVLVTNNYGAATSLVATLTVNVPVQIIGQPSNQAVALNSNANFSVTAVGDIPRSYQWYFNGILLSDSSRVVGSATPTLTVSNAQSGDMGDYWVIVTNVWGAKTSVVASLTLLAPSSTSVLYVNPNNTTPDPPYLSWATAATNIQNAVDTAIDGNLILVTNGVYNSGGGLVYGQSANRVALTKAVTLLSVSGPDATMIVGGATMRCVYVGSNAVLSGFTIMNGHVSINGGGIWCESSAVVSNCLILSNSIPTSYNGVGGGGIYGGTLYDCIITANSSYSGAGAYGSRIFNSTISSNFTANSGYGSGAGAYRCILSNCFVIGNAAIYNAGGGGTALGTNYNCQLIGNSAFGGGGSYQSANYNCTLIGNSANSGGGSWNGANFNCLINNNSASLYGGGVYGGTHYNCTIVNNSATNTKGGGGGAYQASLFNSIIYFNSATNGPNWLMAQLEACCTTPSGYITADPLFVDQMGGNFRLQTNSPCINAGSNLYATNSTDLDGSPRIFGIAVDIGAYEYHGPVDLLFHAWLAKYGLPADGSVDYVDSDGDGMNNWQEWIAGTDPTDSSSVLRIQTGLFTNPPGIWIAWPTSGRTYFLQRSTNLAVQPTFSTIASNMSTSGSGFTSYTDRSATNGGPYFYRVGVLAQ